MTPQVREALAEIQQAEMGRYDPKLEDGLRWERLGLGRVFFEDGRAVWVTDRTREP